MNKISGLLGARMLAGPIVASAQEMLDYTGNLMTGTLTGLIRLRLWVRIALERIVTVLIALIIIASMLMACLVYLFIWLSEKSRPPRVRHKSPMTSEARAVSFSAGTLKK